MVSKSVSVQQRIYLQTLIPLARYSGHAQDRNSRTLSQPLWIVHASSYLCAHPMLPTTPAALAPHPKAGIAEISVQLLGALDRTYRQKPTPSICALPLHVPYKTALYICANALPQVRWVTTGWPLFTRPQTPMLQQHPESAPAPLLLSRCTHQRGACQLAAASLLPAFAHPAERHQRRPPSPAAFGRSQTPARTPRQASPRRGSPIPALTLCRRSG